MKTLADRKTIYLVGTRRFQNQILADFLEKELKAECIVSEDAYRKPPSTNGQKYRVLTLLDFSENDLNKYFTGLESESKKTLDGNIVALFNIKPDSGVEEKAISRGIRGLFYKQDPPNQLVRGISCMFKGEMWYPRDVMARYILSLKEDNQNNRQDVVNLTQRELELLIMVISGSKNKDIANQLFISPSEVRTHIYNIYKKINVPNHLHAALWTARNP